MWTSGCLLSQLLKVTLYAITFVIANVKWNFYKRISYKYLKTVVTASYTTQNENEMK